MLKSGLGKARAVVSIINEVDNRSLYCVLDVGRMFFWVGFLGMVEGVNNSVDNL